MNLRSLMPLGGRTAPARTADPFVSLHREINRLFDDAFRGWPAAAREGGEEAWAPALDVKETDTEIKVTVDLPGVEEKDVEVTLDQDLLTIKGERKFEKEEKDKGYHLMERSYGAFLRQIQLPIEPDRDKVNASFAKGVLTVTLPKTPAAKAAQKKIEIKAAK